MKPYLEKLTRRCNLTQSEAAEAFDLIMAGQATPAQIGAFLAALRTKGESVDELAGGAASMRRHAVRIDPGGRAVVDTCGTGGDACGTFNVSTTAAFVVAGAGVPVAKHGNRAITSRCGSADLLSELGVNIEVAPETVEECIREAGIGFLFAPKLHPAMKHAMGPRKELGVRTIFNMLGPLTNPAGARGQIIGVFAPELTEPFAHVLRLLGSRRAFVVHGHDGMDEMTVTTTTRVSELCDGAVRTYEVDPHDYMEARATAADLAGGEPDQNARITRGVLEGQRGACRDIVCLNAAAAIVAGGKAATLAEGWKAAQQSLDSGQARQALEALIRITQAG
jgi:anthranilate phosphoribosyltransferase